MISRSAPCYHFVTREQRRTLLQAGVAESLTLDPASGTDGREVRSDTVAIAISPDGAVFCVDACGRLFSSCCDTSLMEFGTGSAPRLVSSGERLWVLARGQSLAQVDLSTFQLLFQREAEGITDIAPDGEGGVWLLERRRIRRLTDRGSESHKHLGLAQPALQIAAVGSTLGVLSEDAKSLVIRKRDNSNGFRVDLETLLGKNWPGEKTRISSGRNAFLLAAESSPSFALVDRDGNLIVRGHWRDDRMARLLTMHGGDLLALFEEGGRLLLKRFPGLGRCGGKRILTPALETETPAGTWLRAEIEATLPADATLALRWATTSDLGLALRVGRILEDQNLSELERLKRADSLLEWDGQENPSFTYLGVPQSPLAGASTKREQFVLPLHAAKGSILWVDIQLLNNGGKAEPEFHALSVFHEAESLMDRLPGIYRGSGDRDGTLRRLVGVIEATTQNIDRGIGRMAERLDPTRADKKWLPELSAMLGLPFHEGLPSHMARGVVRSAAPILAGRGTREGLLALLRAVFPGRPVRVVDLTEQMSPLALDGAARLPAVISGASRRVPKLNARFILRKTPLCSATACTDHSIMPPPQVLVVLPATRRERERYSEAIRAMIEEMLPIGVRLRMKWISWTGLRRADDQEVLAMVDLPDELALGSGPALGRARTGGRRLARLDSAGVIPAEHRIL